ncbi:hypothetical protein [uncultured Methylobacterium sp.]|mgnify:CR=1 FL=1|jgi:hypothetical protein|uniref:hypothetical protein n=1 Tax=uncultured Methylobacterium sp. TaxID=157278 RepID=UPI00262C1F42|nr:hypothetical protein [uncultured Methylobacterium sp.]
MVSQPKQQLSFETEWLREYVTTYLLTDSVFIFAPEDLKRHGISLLDLRHGFRFGVVVFSDKLDGPGCRWVVETEDCDGRRITLWLEVDTNAYRLELIRVRRARINGGGSYAA